MTIDKAVYVCVAGAGLAVQLRFSKTWQFVMQFHFEDALHGHGRDTLDNR